MPSVSIVPIERTLVVTVPEDLVDQEATNLPSVVGDAVQRSRARGVLLNLSHVETVDSFLGLVIDETARLTRMLGAETVVVGLQPAVAITIMELGLQLSGVSTALTVEKGMAMLRDLVGRDRHHDVSLG